MTATWRKVRVLLATQFAHMTAYRAEIVIWMLSGTLTLVMMLLWRDLTAQSSSGTIGTYDARDFTTYFIGTWLAGQMLVVWVAWELNFQINQGTLSPQLLRPIDPFWMHYFAHWAERFVRVPLMIVLASVFTATFGAHFTASVSAWLAFIVLVALGFTVRFLWEYCFALLAFWTQTATAFAELTWLAYAALGGIFAPLSLYPPAVQAVARFTPFPYMLGLPSDLISGKADLADAARGAAVLLAWLAALSVLRAALWRAGLRRYGAVGA
ncbi:ABC transporter permease [Deinococcus maricopensis]|uniref:ABC transporter permease protein n=1 Tax=Deinococcus maricopensis (strain DSM 21211 / LMG 22137 / NRRL B-23946 / LB-34) TaxID=709986 RepID=E8U8F1_DEIML|nr:ABC-2 family transporter protein [Deinococcus maricopensis]ADV67340.1 protein of unknown function DUF990 [Deinococcus maricopensis DSM 21211]